jgi:hypothetical protein
MSTNKITSATAEQWAKINALRQSVIDGSGPMPRKFGECRTEAEY